VLGSFEFSSYDSMDLEKKQASGIDFHFGQWLVTATAKVTEYQMDIMDDWNLTAV